MILQQAFFFARDNRLTKSFFHSVIEFVGPSSNLSEAVFQQSAKMAADRFERTGEAVAGFEFFMQRLNAWAGFDPYQLRLISKLSTEIRQNAVFIAIQGLRVR